MDSKAQVVISAIDRFSQTFNSLKDKAADSGAQLDRLKTLALGAAGVFATGALATGIKNTVTGLAALDDAAQATGASVEQLSKIKNVADDYAQPFAEIEAVLPKMIRGLQGVDEETKGAAGALKVLGIDAREANGSFKDSGKLFEEVAVKLSRYEDNADKVAIVQDLLGKSGAKLIPFLNDYASSLDTASTVTADQAKRASDLQDAWTKLGAATTRLKEQLAIEALPVFEAVTKTITDIKRESNALGQETGAREFAKYAALGLATLYDGARAIPVIFRIVGSTLAGLVVDAVTAFEAMAKGAEVMGRAINGALTKDPVAILEALNAFGEARALLSRVGDGLGNAKADIEGYVDSFTSGSARLRLEANLAGRDVPINLRAIDNALTGDGTAQKAKLGNYAAGLKQVGKEAKDAGEMARQLDALRNKLNNPEVEESYRKQIELLTKALQVGAIGFGEYGVLIAKASEQSKTYKDAVKDLADQEKELAEIKREALDIESKLIASANDDTAAIIAKNDALRTEIASLGLSERALNDRNIALLQSKLAAFEAVSAISAMSDADYASADAIRAQIAALQERGGLIDAKNVAESAGAARDAFDAKWRGVGDDLTDWIMGGMKNTKELIKRLFADLVLRPIIAPIGQSLSGGLSSLFGGGSSSGGLGGLFGNLFGGGGGGGGGLLSSLGGLGSSFFGGAASLAANFGLGAAPFLAGAGPIASGTGLAGFLSGTSGGLLGSIGSALPVIGPIVAAVSALWKPLFGRKLKDSGVEATLSSDSVSGRSFEFYKGGLFRSDKTKYSDLDAGALDALTQARDTVFGALRSFTADLGIEAKALDAVSYSFKISTKGLSEEQIKAKFAEEMDKFTLIAAKSIDFSGVSEAFGASVKNFTGSGEELLKFINDYVTVVNLVKEAQAAANAAMGGYADELDMLQAQRDNGVLAGLRLQQMAVDKLLAASADGDGMMGNLLQGMTALRAAAIAFQDQVAQVRAQSADAFGASIRDLKMSVMSDEEKYKFLQGETDLLAAKAMASSDPLQIAKLRDEILGNVSSAMGLLSDDQRRLVVPEQIARLEALQAKFDERLQTVGKTESDRMAEKMDAISKKLDEVAILMLKGAEGVQKGGADILAAAGTPRNIDINFSANVPGQVTYSEVGG
jgi:hypothetical protein